MTRLWGWILHGCWHRWGVWGVVERMTYDVPALDWFYGNCRAKRMCVKCGHTQTKIAVEARP